ncbi:phosphatase PAP2 family protein [Aestuariivivens sediminicola]|uniref:phosphatase PAP2 family protein n=1 Tax=Aestuariivivens sediminicola TaxID=2913560 RepID=UPI001F58EE4B|nr:phosphatase PAP2 family protein [Aestuariivivens sediminicola]
MLDQILHYDTELFLYLNNLGSPSWDGFWLAITNKFIFGSLMGIVLFVLLYRKFGLKYTLLLIVVVALMITFTDQITNLFKRTFERHRPCRTEVVMDQMRFIAVRCGLYGFFSGHASNSMAVAIFGGLMLRSQHKWLLFALISFSLLVAYSRIYVGVHYPLDIICGLIFGVFSGSVFYKLAQGLLKRFDTSRNRIEK